MHPKKAQGQIKFKKKELEVLDLENYDFSKAELLFLLQEVSLQNNGFQKQVKKAKLLLIIQGTLGWKRNSTCGC